MSKTSTPSQLSEITATISEDEIMSKRTPKGAWTRQQLAEWGVPWPPPPGWKAKLIANNSRAARKQ